jgi:hypothetical protein
VMVSITINEFAKSYVQTNKGEGLHNIKLKLKEAVSNKEDGVVCISCGAPIWAIGSAIVEWSGCFTCITGQTDSSQDYEIDEVNY